MISQKNTFIVLAYNHERYIKECLNSIEQQTTCVYELIISDDASQDGTKEEIRKFIKKSKIQKITFIDHQNNKGLIDSLNACLGAVTGDLIFIQAGDDASQPNRVKVTEEYFLRTKYKVLYSSYQMMDESSLPFKTKNRSGVILDPAKLIKKGASIPPFGTAFTRDFLVSIFPIDQKLKNEDDYIGMSAILYGGLLVVSNILYKYRVHSNSLSSWNNIKTERNIFLEKYFSDQTNRVENILAWRDMIVASDKIKSLEKEALLKLIEKKINIKFCICSLRKLKLRHRVKTLIANVEAANLQDAITLIFGINGLLLIRFIRRLRLRVL